MYAVSFSQVSLQDCRHFSNLLAKREDTGEATENYEEKRISEKRKLADKYIKQRGNSALEVRRLLKSGKTVRQTERQAKLALRVM